MHAGHVLGYNFKNIIHTVKDTTSVLLLPSHRAQGSLKSLQVLLESSRVDVARQTRTKQTTLVLATTQVLTDKVGNAQTASLLCICRCPCDRYTCCCIIVCFLVPLITIIRFVVHLYFHSHREMKTWHYTCWTLTPVICW